MDLFKRVISAAVLIAIILSCLFLGEITTVILTAVVCALMVFDVSNALRAGGYKANRWVLVITSLLVTPTIYFYGFKGIVFLCALSFAVMALIVVFSKEPDFKVLIGGGLTLIYPLVLGALMVALAMFDLSHTGRYGAKILIGVATCATLGDTFAYFFGKFFGKRKLCPQISPKKTVVGSIASFFGGVVGGAIMFFFANTATLNIYNWLIIGFACGGFAQIGDLTASLLKRFCSVKDFGTYIPGHGGIMDRMDSISFCLIAIVSYVQFFVMEII